MLIPEEVSAVVVTRGNVDLTPVVESLARFDEVIVFDNSYGSPNDTQALMPDGRRFIVAGETEDLMTYGIVAACERARNPVIFSTDDDIIHTPENQARIVAKYRPGVLTGCMWDEWSAGAAAQGIPGGYQDLVFYGSGAVYDRYLPAVAASRYLEHHPWDDFFLLWFSCVLGILAPTRQLDIRFEALPCAEAPDRMCNLPNAAEHKAEAIRRAREIRDAARVAA